MFFVELLETALAFTQAFTALKPWALAIFSQSLYMEERLYGLYVAFKNIYKQLYGECFITLTLSSVTCIAVLKNRVTSVQFFAKHKNR